MMKKNIAILFGGRSSEHEVSIRSAFNIYKALDKNLFQPVLIGISKEGTWYQISEEQFNHFTTALTDENAVHYSEVTFVVRKGKPELVHLNTQQKHHIDVVFPIIHGTNGEDGTLQGYLKLLNIPFVGCGVLSSAVAMDKEAMKIVMTQAGIPNAKYRVLKSNEKYNYDSIAKDLGSTFFIKPANAGSSVGVHKIKNAEDFDHKLKDAFLYDHKVLAEEFIQGREIECSVKGLNSSPKASLPGELVIKHEFYSYEAKYIDENGAEIIIPARLDQEKIKQIQELAIKTYQALFCDGLTRVDFFVKQNGDLYVNEINTLPGFTKISMYPMMWQATGIEYTQLVTELIETALQKHEIDNQIKMTFL